MPLHEDLPDLIERDEISATQDVKIRGKRLVEEFEWEKEDAQKIWCFGPENVGPNVVVDMTKGVQYMNEIKESMVSSFQWTSRQGVLCEESMRGMRFNVVDCELHTDAIHRGGGQIMPTARRLYYALELFSAPTLLEPIFLAEITAPVECMGGIYQTLTQRRGEVVEETQIVGTPLNMVKAYLPVSESFGFTGTLRGNTQGKAFPQCNFDHWNLIKGMPLVDPKAGELILSIRKRKGLKEEMPLIENYQDKK